jgi:hypothetical protein
VLNERQRRLRKPDETASDKSHFARKAKWGTAQRSTEAERQTGRILLEVAAVRRGLLQGALRNSNRVGLVPASSVWLCGLGG